MAMGLGFGRGKINRIVFVFVNSTFRKGDVYYQNVSETLPAQVLLTKSRILGAK